MTAAGKAPLVEVFASVQGEGRFVGQPMTFVRVAVCPLRCSYCDTPHSYTATPEFGVQVGTDTQNEKNPVTAERAVILARQAAAASSFGGADQAVSLTGGEPLVYPQFVAAVGHGLRSHGQRLHLETAAHDAAALRQCIDAVDHLSADWKLPATMRGDGGHATDLLAANLACIEMAVAAGITVDVKVVLTDAVEVSRLAEDLAGLTPLADHIELFLQPVTPYGDVGALPSGKLQAAAVAARSAGLRPRVLPQLHPVLGLR